jgi:hypothetical protein
MDNKNNNICTPTSFSAAVFGVANVLTEKLDSDELALYGAFLTALGDTLTMNGIIVEQCNAKN